MLEVTQRSELDPVAAGDRLQLAHHIRGCASGMRDGDDARVLRAEAGVVYVQRTP